VHRYLIPRYADKSVHGVAVLNEMFADQPWACSDDDAAEAASRVRAALSGPE
jgi:hypothetical protein